MADLDEAVTVHREALRLRPIGHLLLSSSIGNLARAVQFYFTEKSDAADLDESIALHREGRLLDPAGPANRSAMLNNLTESPQTRFAHRGNIVDLDYAPSGGTSHTPNGSSGPLSQLEQLGGPCLYPFQADGWHGELGLAISFHCDVLLLRRMVHPNGRNLIVMFGPLIYRPHIIFAFLLRFEEADAPHAGRELCLSFDPGCTRTIGGRLTETDAYQSV